MEKSFRMGRASGSSTAKNEFSYTTIIIIINVVLFFAFLALGFRAISCQSNICASVALRPLDIVQGQNVWTLVTNMFMHVGISHLFVNMISLMFLGSFVEKLVGKRRFLWLYLGSGLFAGVLFVILAGFLGMGVGAQLFGSPLTYAVGASGAIFGLGGLLAVLTPKLKVLVMFIFPMPMWAAMAFLIAGIWLLSFTLNLPIGNTAHLGGLIVGVGYGFYLKHKYPRKAKMISRYFS